MQRKQLPPIGFGTYDIFEPSEIVGAIDIGYRLIDTAEWYDNEDVVGQALSESPVDREEIVLESKVLPDNLAGKDVIRSTEESLDRLNVETIDIHYIHWPTNAYDPADTLAAFDQLVDENKIRHIGVSNFTPELLDEAMELTENPILANQVEMHPLLQQEELQSYAAQEDITLVGYAPLAQGKVFDVPEVTEVAEKHGANEAQVSLAWLMEKNVVPIPKASGDHIQDNYEALELDLDAEDIGCIDSIEDEVRVVHPDDEEKVDSNPWA